MMHLKGFKRGVKKLAKGRYHCVKHQITEYNDGEVKHIWAAYTEDASWTKNCSAPEAALSELERMCTHLK